MDFNRGRYIAIIGGVAVGLLTARALYQTLKKKNEVDTKTAKYLVTKWEPVGKVSSLHIYPIKSCHRVKVDEGYCDVLGLKSGSYLRDRCFLVVNENNNFLHARIHPSMVLIEPKIENSSIELKAPNMDPIKFNIPSFGYGGTVTVKVWGEEVPAIDCGEEVALWLSQYIFQKDTGARLVYYPQEHTAREAKTKAVFPWMKKADGAAFHDLAPYHLISEESIADLNSRLPGDDQISMLNFRPTIAISGCPAFEEDTWTFIRIGDTATFRFMKPCDRCVLTTINPATGVKHPEVEPLRTLRKYRLAQDSATRKVTGESPFLGVNYAAEAFGHIRVGDVIYAGRF